MANQKASNLTFNVTEVIKICVLTFALAGIYYEVKESNKLSGKIASSLNKTNKKLLIRGVIDDADFVYRESKADNVEVAKIDPKDIIDKRKQQRLSNSETACDNTDFESKILE
ncbi:MAG: hypothetical protein GY928_22145 [Colwellia sp.]|nr:hypothetical protein [Colwellia sp.]